MIKIYSDKKVFDKEKRFSMCYVWFGTNICIDGEKIKISFYKNNFKGKYDVQIQH